MRRTVIANAFVLSVFMAAAIVLLSFASGCRTSAQFKGAAMKVGPDLSDSALAYVSADSSLSPDVKADRLAKVARLRKSTAQYKNVSRSEVTAAWGDVKAFYLPYVDADQKLDVEEKHLRHVVADKFDKLIADDAARPFAKF